MSFKRTGLPRGGVLVALTCAMGAIIIPVAAFGLAVAIFQYFHH